MKWVLPFITANFIYFYWMNSFNINMKCGMKSSEEHNGQFFEELKWNAEWNYPWKIVCYRSYEILQIQKYLMNKKYKSVLLVYNLHHKDDHIYTRKCFFGINYRII